MSTTASKGGSEPLFKQLAELCARLDVGRHPLHRRWSTQTLGTRDCQIYVEEYDHLIFAVASITQRAAEKASGLMAHALAAHARREAAELDQWRELAKHVGWDPRSAWYYGADPLASTEACMRTWSGAPTRPLALDLTTLSVISSPHMRLSHERAELMNAALSGVLPDTTDETVLLQARCVLRAHLTMLDCLHESLR